MSTVIEPGRAQPQHLDGLPPPFRWMLEFPGSPFWPATGFGLLCLFLGIATVGIDFTPIGIWDHVAYALYVAWVPLAVVALVRGSARDARDLAPELGEDAASLTAQVFAAGSRAMPWSLPVSVAMSSLTLLVAAREGFLDQAQAATFVAVREVAVEVAIFGVLAWAAGAARSLSGRARSHARPDLLDARPLSPLARCGTRMFLFWVLLIALNAPFFFGEGPPAYLLPVMLGVILFMLALAVAALAIPTWGARQAIRDAKSAELDRVRGQIRDARMARDDGRLPGLLAWEERIESVREWPIDAGSLRLTGLYVLIPLLSWVGAALVERGVDVLFP